jgi:hypothetical protein
VEQHGRGDTRYANGMLPTNSAIQGSAKKPALNSNAFSDRPARFLKPGRSVIEKASRVVVPNAIGAQTCQVFETWHLDFAQIRLPIIAKRFLEGGRIRMVRVEHHLFDLALGCQCDLPTDLKRSRTTRCTP